MKTGKTLSSLAAEIERQMETKKDYVASTKNLAFVADFAQPPIVFRDTQTKAEVQLPQVGLRVGDEGRSVGTFPITHLAHDQIAEHVKIPKPYYERMRTEAPDLLATNVNRWFSKYPAPRMIRTLDGRARAMMSNGYQCLDNHDFAGAVLPILAQRKLTVMSAEITETRLYIKAVDEQLFRDVPVGFKMGDGSHRIFDTCAPAVILSNSEVGFGRLVVETGVFSRACTNLALFPKSGFKRTHVGARHKLIEGIDVADLDEIMSNDTKKKTLEALWGQVRDVVASSFDEKVVTKRAEAFEAAAGRKITADVEQVMTVVQTRFELNDGERSSIFKHLIEGGSLTQYGLHAAITRAAQDVESYDRATELEYLGGKVVELPRSEWAQLAEAA